MSTTVTYKGETLATVTNSTKVLETGGTWLEDDITLVDVTSGGGSSLGTKSITSNGTYNASSDGYDGYSQVTVNVSGGVTPTGTKQISITENGTTTEDVTSYANAEITVNVSGASGWDADDIASRAAIDGAVVCSTATKLYPYCFAYTKITSFQSDTVTSLENTDSFAHYFYKATSLASVSMPNVNSQIGNNSFQNCSALETVNIPNGLLGRVSAFNSCTSLREAVFPKTPSVANSVFNNCPSLAKADLGSSAITTSGNIAANAFAGCTSLNVLILRKGVAYGLDNISAFSNTPFASGKSGGTLYVPNSLISAYQSITNWATILGYPNNSIQAIEGSIYE